MPWKKDLPVLDGPTTNRLLKVRLERTVHFTFPHNVEFDVVDTQNFGRERYANGSVAVDQSNIALRLETHLGQPILTILFEGSLKAIPWHWVKDFTPHPDFVWDQVPASTQPVADTTATPAPVAATSTDVVVEAKKGK